MLTMMKNSFLLLVLSLPMLVYGQAVTPVHGESWLEHLHRTFNETSMGRSSWVYGPAAPMPGAWPPPSHLLSVSASFTGQTTTLYGSDLYRIKCRSCHGPVGAGAPPEINSVLDPIRATSASLYIERMKKVGMDVSMRDAAPLARQASQTLMDRLHNGGKDMPRPDPPLTDVELRSLLAYLRQLAGIPGAGKQQVAVQESQLRVGEYIVKSTCHICHSAVGVNPNPRELMDGKIPPLSTLTSRVSLNEFVAKVVTGAPILEGEPAIPVRGHMPVFDYLNVDEAANAYLYLLLYPPHE